MNHGQPARLFYRPECYEWLFKHSLKDNDEGFKLSGDIFRNAYRQARAGATIASK